VTFFRKLGRLVKKYIRVTTVKANLSGIGFIHLRLLRKNLLGRRVEMLGSTHIQEVFAGAFHSPLWPALCPELPQVVIHVEALWIQRSPAFYFVRSINSWHVMR
jgi:hypothetical protein